MTPYCVALAAAALLTAATLTVAAWRTLDQMFNILDEAPWQ